MKEEEENNKQNSQSSGAYKARKTWNHNLQVYTLYYKMY